MTAICSFPPIADKKATVLILGSMPGEASLAAGQYYAHKHNLFWPLLADVLGETLSADYAGRVRILKRHSIALWDVLETCIRPGSLDSAIRAETVNDFAAFLAAHPRIHTICFNGQKAAKSFRRHVLKTLPGAENYTFHTLPSTSPANASWTRARKRAAWNSALQSVISA